MEGGVNLSNFFNFCNFYIFFWRAAMLGHNFPPQKMYLHLFDETRSISDGQSPTKLSSCVDLVCKVHRGPAHWLAVMYCRTCLAWELPPALLFSIAHSHSPMMHCLVLACGLFAVHAGVLFLDFLEMFPKSVVFN